MLCCGEPWKKRQLFRNFKYSVNFPAERQSTTDTTSKAQHGSCQIGETHFNATLKMGIHSGKFKKLGRVDNMEDCIEICCKENDLDAAFMLGKLCYSVKCYNSDLCQIRPAFVSSLDMLNVNPAVAFIHNNNDHKGNFM
jgi:hypothetical protein